MFLLNRFTEVLLVPVFYLLARSTTKNSPHQRQQVCPHPYKFFNALHGSKMCSFSDKVKTNSDNMQMSRSEWNVWLENLLLWQIHHLHLTVSFFYRKRNSRSAGKSVLRWLDQSLLRESTGEENSNFFSLVSGSQWVMGTSGDFLTCALEMVEVWLNITLRRNRCCFFKPLHPYISMYILRTGLYTFSKVLTRRV